MQKAERKNEGVCPSALEPLRNIPVWVAWEYVKPRNPQAKWPKVPVIPTGRPLAGRWAGTDYSEQWGVFDQALATPGWGVGIVTGPEAWRVMAEYGFDYRLIFIDPDNCEHSKWARELVEECQSYAEWSVSGTGIHIYGVINPIVANMIRGRDIDLPRDPGHLEVFGTFNQYSVVTGNTILDMPLADLSNIVTRLWEESQTTPRSASTRSAGPQELLSVKGPWTEARAMDLMPGFRWFARDKKDLPDEIQNFIVKPHLPGGRGPKLSCVIMSAYHHYFDAATLFDILWENKEGVSGCCEGKEDELWRQIIKVVVKFCKPYVLYNPSDYLACVDRVEELLSDADILERQGFLYEVIPRKMQGPYNTKYNDAALKLITKPTMREFMARKMDFVKWTKEGPVKIGPPLEVSELIVDRAGKSSFRPFRAFALQPTFRQDGTILTTPGYDPDTKLFLIEQEKKPLILPNPTEADADVALAYFEDLIKEFPWVDDESKAAALAMLITFATRGLYDVVPMMIVNAPQARNGKSYFCQIASMIALGVPVQFSDWHKDEEENKKYIASLLAAGKSVVCFGNVQERVNNSLLCETVSATSISYRILGHTRIDGTVDHMLTPMMNGNNVVELLVGNINERVIIAAMNANVPKPGERKFAGNPMRTIAQNWHEVIGHGINLINAYRMKGPQTPVTPPWSGFDRWAVVRGALMWRGRADPYSTTVRARENDPERLLLAGFLSGWEKLGYGNERTVQELLKDIELRKPGVYDGTYGDYVYDGLRDAILMIAGVNGKVNARSLGKWMALHLRDQTTGMDVQIVKGKYLHGYQRWSVTHVKPLKPLVLDL